MNRALIRLDGYVLDQFHPQSRGLFPGYSRTLEIVYTVGKSSEWGGSQQPTVDGALGDATIRTQTRHLYGRILIDVLSCKKSSTPYMNIGGEISTGAETFEELRRSVFKTFAHESFHVVQAWLLGGKHVLIDRNWENLYRSLLLKEGAFYHKNLHEQAAFERSWEVSGKFFRQVDQGQFDFLFALDVLHEVRAPASTGNGKKVQNKLKTTEVRK
jgi:hypothetical protein